MTEKLGCHSDPKTKTNVMVEWGLETKYLEVKQRFSLRECQNNLFPPSTSHHCSTEPRKWVGLEDLGVCASLRLPVVMMNLSYNQACYS